MSAAPCHLVVIAGLALAGCGLQNALVCPEVDTCNDAGLLLRCVDGLKQAEACPSHQVCLLDALGATCQAPLVCQGTAFDCVDGKIVDCSDGHRTDARATC